jgi:CheY-like chemotaxis protein
MPYRHEQPTNKVLAYLSSSRKSLHVYPVFKYARSAFPEMRTGLTLLLTHDPMVEEAMVGALLQEGGISCLARTSDDAMGIVCSKGSELELAVIDFDHGSNGMTLMSAIDACANHHLPMLALTGAGEKHARFVALANGAAECLAKPVSVAQLANVIVRYRPKWELAQVA